MTNVIKPHEMSSHVNSEREKVSIEKIRNGAQVDGTFLLTIHDDPPPHGTGTRAPMLLDDGTIDWLLRQIKAIRSGVYQ